MKTKLSYAYGCPDLNILRELCSYDILCPECCDFVPDGSLYQICPKTRLCSLHWSRQYEYPWAITNSTFKPTDVCLEAGGSYCTFKYALAKRCSKVISIDIDLEAQKKAFNSTVRLGFNNIFYNNVAIQDFKYEEKFDKIYCISVIEHIKDKKEREDCIENMLNLLKPGGELYLSFDIKLIDSNNHNFHLGAKEAGEMLSRFGTNLLAYESPEYVPILIDNIYITAMCLKVWDI